MNRLTLLGALAALALAVAFRAHQQRALEMDLADSDAAGVARLAALYGAWEAAGGAGVPVLEWPGAGARFLAACVGHGRPVVLRNTVVTRWNVSD